MPEKLESIPINTGMLFYCQNLGQMEALSTFSG
jgi:hypothetical protein